MVGSLSVVVAEAVLKSAKEEDIHVFIAEHPFLLGFLSWEVMVRSEFRLAGF